MSNKGQSNENAIQKIAIDIGYGDTKVCVGDYDLVAENDELVIKWHNPEQANCFKFPSAVARVKESLSSFGDDEIPDSYLFNGKRYFVGEKANHDALSTRGFGFLEKYAPLIAYHAIVKSGIDLTKPFELHTGLSIMNWANVDEYAKALTNFQVDGKTISPTPAPFIYAQGQGVLVDYSDTNGLVCVVDIGYNTFDFLVFEDGTPRKDLSYGVPIGANRIITELQAKIQRKFNTTVTEQAAKEVFMKGEVKNFGETIDFSDEIKELKNDYCEFILDELRTKSIDVLRNADKVIFSGGGAYFLKGADQLPSNVVFSPAPYEFANVRGYYTF